MARGINKVILIGNLGKDPEVRYAPGGGAIANLTLATSETWKDKTTGDNQEHTEWHRVVMFDRLAEIAGEYLKKGSKVYIEGKLQTRKWQDQSGQDRYTTEIVAKEIQMLGSHAEKQMNVDRQDDRKAAGQPQTQSQQRSKDMGFDDDFDDDIPF